MSSEPADLPLLDVPIDNAKWHQPKNQVRPRNQPVEGQQEIKRHRVKLLECGAISPLLHASAYSQVLLLVSKPDTKEKRVVLDYRALNKCVSHMNWPLPNICHMIERMGALKPKKFAKFDMTKGYWQLGLAPAVRLYYLDGKLCIESNPYYGITASRILLSVLHSHDNFGGARLCHMRRLY